MRRPYSGGCSGFIIGTLALALALVLPRLSLAADQLLNFEEIGRDDCFTFVGRNVSTRGFSLSSADNIFTCNGELDPRGLAGNGSRAVFTRNIVIAHGQGDPFDLVAFEWNNSGTGAPAMTLRVTGHRTNGSAVNFDVTIPAANAVDAFAFVQPPPGFSGLASLEIEELGGELFSLDNVVLGGLSQVVPVEMGLIQGIIWHDSDRDGFLDPGELPLDGVDLVLVGTDLSPPRFLGMVTTASGGHYEFPLQARQTMELRLILPRGYKGSPSHSSTRNRFEGSLLFDQWTKVAIYNYNPFGDRVILDGAIYESLEPLSWFPLLVGAHWNYLDEQGGVGRSTVTGEGIVIDNWQTFEITDTNGDVSYWSNDERVWLHGALIHADQSSVFYRSPLELFDDGTVPRSQTVHGSIFAYDGPVQVTLDYVLQQTIADFETVTVPFGSLRALRIDSTLTLTDGVTVEITSGTDWVARDIGSVRAATDGIVDAQLVDFFVDIDGDGRSTQNDNCIDVPNPAQGDIDADGIGDLCDFDRDGDRIPDMFDLCPSDPAPSLGDNDGDGYGDSCDSDDDNDGLADALEIQFGTDPYLTDSDADGLSDYAEVNGAGDPTMFDPDRETDPANPDTDGDGLLDGEDPKPLSPVRAHKVPTMPIAALALLVACLGAAGLAGHPRRRVSAKDSGL